MKPRTVHLLILAALCVAPASLGAWLFSSLIVWKMGATAPRVFAVHGSFVGLALMFAGLHRLSFLVSP